MEDTPNLNSKYRLGFRLALTSHLKKKPPSRLKGGPYDSLRKAWRARCFALGNLSEQFPDLTPYARFAARRASCDARDVFPPVLKTENQGGNKDKELIFRCHQAWICPWCSTRPTVRVLRKAFLSLKCVPDRLKGYVWTTAGWKWNLGRIDTAVASKVEQVLEELSNVRARTTVAVSTNAKKTAAYISRMRLMPGRSMIEGSPPPLVLSYRCAFLSQPNALVPRRWSVRPSEVVPGAEADNYARTVHGYDDLCRFLAAYPPGLLHARPLDLAHLLRVKGDFRRKHRLVNLSLPDIYH